MVCFVLDEFEIVDVEESEDCQQASKLNETIDIIKGATYFFYVCI